MVIIDTTVWVDYLRGTVNPQTVWLEHEIGRTNLGLTDLILCEVLQGIPNDRQFRMAREDLLKYQIFQTGGEEIAVASAKNYLFLRERGYTIRKTIDCLIATFCVMDGHTLLHRDRDFNAFERHLGLKVLHPRLR